MNWAINAYFKWKHLGVHAPSAFPQCTVILSKSLFVMMDWGTNINTHKVLCLYVKLFSCQSIDRRTLHRKARPILWPRLLMREVKIFMRVLAWHDLWIGVHFRIAYKSQREVWRAMSTLKAVHCTILCVIACSDSSMETCSLHNIVCYCLLR